MATLATASTLASLPPPESEREARRHITQTVTEVSRKLGNTPAVCRRAYVHPTVLDTYTAGDLADVWKQPAATRPRGLIAEERKLLALLDRGARAAQRAA
jgi:DNA topoisomerase-1